MTRHRSTLAFVAGLVALGALLIGGWAAAQFRSATLGRPWFVAPSQLVVAENGTLVVGIGETEVQVYASDGAPRSAWYRVEPGPFRLVARSDDRIAVVSPSGDVVLRDADGQMLGEERDAAAYDRAGAPSREGVAADGTRYALRPEGLVAAPRGGGAGRVLVPAPPWPLSWFGTRPVLPVMLTLIASLVGGVACIGLARRPDAA